MNRNANNPSRSPRSPLYFASGSNRSCEIRGFAAIGHAIGVAVSHLTNAAIDALCALAGTGLPVFVDSGAFSEIDFTANGPVVVNPITAADWADRLAVYATLADSLGSQLNVVAPDMVGNQDVTLARLARYADEMAAIAATGATVLVPIQKGALSQVEFHAAVAAVLGDTAWTPALPCKKAATTTDEIVAYCAAVQPARVHLLGLGITNSKAATVLARVAAVAPNTVVQLDSCAIRANVGWNNGRNGGPRRLTIAKEIVARAGFAADETQEIAIGLVFGPGGDKVWDYQAEAVAIRAARKAAKAAA